MAHEEMEAVSMLGTGHFKGKSYA